MKIIVDMNLPATWCAALRRAGHEANHWSNLGAANATDVTIMAWAKRTGAVVMTRDLDFGDLLVESGATGPSVVLLRTQSVFPERTGELVLRVLAQFAGELTEGSLVSIDEGRARIRILPFNV